VARWGGSAQGGYRAPSPLHPCSGPCWCHQTPRGWGPPRAERCRAAPGEEPPAEWARAPAPDGRAGGHRGGRGSPHRPILGPGRQPLPTHRRDTGASISASPPRSLPSGIAGPERGAVPVPQSCPAQGPHEQQRPEPGAPAWRGLPTLLRVCGRAPPAPPRPAGPQLGHAGGSLRGPRWHEGTALASLGDGEHRGRVPAQLLIIDRAGTATQPRASLFSLFYFLFSPPQ